MSLYSDLAWLEAEHPDRTVLISLVKSHIQTWEMAHSCDSVCFHLDGTVSGTHKGVPYEYRPSPGLMGFTWPI